MPSNFRCKACRLRFTVGWSHTAGAAEGYGAVSRLVCSSCGTEHAIEIAMRDRGPARIALYDVTLAEIEPGQRVRALAVVRRLFDMSLEEAGEALDAVPMPMARRVSEEIATELRDAFAGVATVTLREVESQPNPLHGPLRTDRFLSGGRPRFEDEPSFDEIEPEGPREGPCGEFELGAQLCSSCGARATLVGDPMQLGATCPACREDALECVESWTT